MVLNFYYLLSSGEIILDTYICTRQLLFSFQLSQDWYRVSESYKTSDVQWALQTKAILDRLQLVLADRALDFQNKIQPSAEYLGKLLGIGKTVVCDSTSTYI